MMKKLPTIEQAEAAIYYHGVHVALIVLKEEQDNENYELCNIIKKAIDIVIEGREWYLSSHPDGFLTKSPALHRKMVDHEIQERHY